MADFVQRLRMNNVFPSGGYNPIGAPEIGGGGSMPDMISSIISRVQPFLDRNRQSDMEYANNQMLLKRRFQLEDQAREDALNGAARTGNPLSRNRNSNTGGFGGPINTNGMNYSYGGEIGQTRINGETLQEASDRVHGGNEKRLAVSGQYIPEQDKPTSQKSLLERDAAKYTHEDRTAATKFGYETQLENTKSKNKTAEEKAKEEEVRKTKMAGAGQISTIKDPDDPSKEISVIIKPDGSVVRAKLDDDGIGEAFKSDKKPKLSAAEQKAAADEARRNESNRQMAQSTLESLDELYDFNSGKLRPEIEGAVGPSRYIKSFGGLGFLPGSESRTANRKLQAFTSQTVLNLIGELKAQSKTGSTGFGNMNLRELAVLEQAANKLDPLMDEGDYAAELGKIRAKLIKILEPTVDKAAVNNSGAGGTDSSGRRRRSPQELLDFYSKEGAK